MKINWLKEVEKRKDQLINETQEFLRINSVLDESTASAGQPFGKGIANALQHMLTEGEDRGFSVKNLDGYAGYVEHGSGKESVGILCHLDVVPAGTGWTSPPFAAEIREGKLFARGAIDNKGPTMAAFFALALVKELNVELSKRVRIIFGTDEESNWRCVEHYFKHEEMPTIGFAPDADFPIIHAEKGIMDVELKFSEKDSDGEVKLETFKSGERLNMVPESAEVKLKGNEEHLASIINSFATFLDKKTLEGSFDHTKENLVLSIFGKSAHGSTPERGMNASLYLAEFMHSLPLKGIPSFISLLGEKLQGDFNGETLGINEEDKVSGPLTINVGKVSFQRGSACTVGLNIRYPVTADGDKIIHALKVAAKNNQAEVKVIDHMTPSYVEGDHPLIKTLQGVYERQTGEKADLLAIGGGTYARSLDVGVAFGPMFPGREDVAHQKDEYILIDDLVKSAAIYAEAIYELAK
ncbi:dipeptidase PepV [Alkalihalophilus pseudofirmus]|uniref:dipeptidase PepV n=1 Tax=Alkalihalophilus pseudofirmus TaxID=79885 RepID=UPI00259B912C|nr:dipeptidase PepV [Alkalihalophilus pseudofirmus]WEG16300.1 dipeptidase PepV [Alkalihalophilus pseudofirmus]